MNHFTSILSMIFIQVVLFNSLQVVNECFECHKGCFDMTRFFFTFQLSCSFTVGNLSNVPTGKYAMALQIEDFINTSSTVPLSNVPLQFVIHVDSANPITFISPTPSDGSILLFTTVSLQFIAKARVQCTSVE